MRIELLPAALDDLQNIQAHIGFDRPRAAARMYARLVAACDGLATFPLKGRSGQEPGTRELVTVRPFVIVYEVLPDRIDILRVWHAAQDRSSGD